jgi:hypothetical protein
LATATAHCAGNLPLVCLTKKNLLKYLQTLLQEATPKDLLSLPMIEEEVGISASVCAFAIIACTASSPASVTAVVLQVFKRLVAELLISMGDSLKE